MKSIKKITVFYTDGTFEDIEKPQTIDLGKINPTPVPISTYVGEQYKWPAPAQAPIASPVRHESITIRPQPLGSAEITSYQIPALTTAQISSLTSYTYSSNAPIQSHDC